MAFCFSLKNCQNVIQLPQIVSEILNNKQIQIFPVNGLLEFLVLVLNIETAESWQITSKTHVLQYFSRIDCLYVTL